MGKHTTAPDGGLLELALVSDGSKLCAWSLRPGSAPHAEKINGENVLPLDRSHGAIAKALKNVFDRLHVDGSAPRMAHLLLNAEARHRWLAELTEGHAAEKDLLPWHMLAWEWLRGRFPQLPDALDGHDGQCVHALQNWVLPWLLAADNATERQRLKSQRESEDRNEREKLAAERQRLARENETLRAQNAAMQQMDTELLLSYLPALYEGVFSSKGISPADLALLCGHLKPADIPNPYPEPTPEAQAALQRRFRKLPPEVQQRIVAFVQPYPRVQPRPAVRRLLEELGEENASNLQGD